MSERGPLYPDKVLRRDGDGRRFRSAAAMLVDRRRPGTRRLLMALSLLMVLGGVGLFSYPFLTNLYADWRQSGLEEQLEAPETATAYAARRIETGDALTMIKIPALGVEAVVVAGTTAEALRAGAGHYSQTALPCETGNAAIAGHRTTFSKPFANVDRLGPGDEIIVETPVGSCTYAVKGKPWITHPNDASVLDAVRRDSVLTLTTCNPPGSSTERLIVRAELVSSEVA